MLFWVRNLPLFSGLCKWDVTRYIYNLGIFSSIFNIFQFLHYSKRQHSYFLLNCNHQRSKMTSLKTICPLLIKIFSNISEQPWMGVMIMLQVLRQFLVSIVNWFIIMYQINFLGEGVPIIRTLQLLYSILIVCIHKLQLPLARLIRKSI